MWSVWLVVVSLLLTPQYAKAGWNAGGGGGTSGAAYQANDCINGAVLAIPLQQCVDNLAPGQGNLYTCFAPANAGVAGFCDAPADWLLNSSSSSSGVSTFNTRAGAVVPAANDYTATQVLNAPTGGVAATTVQAAITELDSEAAKKAATFAQFTTPSTSADLAGVLSDERGATGGFARIDGTLAVTTGKTATVTNSLTLSGSDGTTMTFPPTSGTVATLDATQTFTNKTFTQPTILDYTNMQHSHLTAAQGGNLSAAATTSGVFNTARLGTGTADATKVLRGDGTWGSVTGNGDVLGPASSIDAQVAVYSGTTGKSIKTASMTIDASGNATITNTLSLGGALSLLQATVPAVPSAGILTLAAPASISAPYVWVVPAAPATGFVRTTNSAGVMSTTIATLSDSDVPDDITINQATTALALKNAPAVCAAGQATRGIDASGNATSFCFTPSGTGDVLSTLPLSQFTSQTTSAQFFGIINDETGNAGSIVRSTNATLDTVTLNGLTTLANVSGSATAGWISRSGGMNMIGGTSSNRTLINASSSTGGAIDLITGGTETSTVLLSLTKDGVLTLDPANVAATPQVDFRNADVTRLFAQAAGAAPTLDNDCRWDSTAHRLKCGENGTSRTIAWTSETTGSLAVNEISQITSCVDNGSSDDYACSMSPTISSYVANTRYWINANTPNTGGATINLNSLGSKQIFKLVNNVKVALDTGDIQDEQWFQVAYDGTDMVLITAPNNLQNAYTASGTNPSITLGANGFDILNVTSATQSWQLCGDLTCTAYQRHYYDSGTSQWITETVPSADSIFTLPATRGFIVEKSDNTDLFTIAEGSGTIAATGASNIDFSATSKSKPCKMGTTPPTALGENECFIDTDAGISSRFLISTAPGVWTAQGGGSGTLTAPATLTAASDGPAQLTIQNQAANDRIRFGTIPADASLGAIYLGAGTATANNYALNGDLTTTRVNAGTTGFLAANGTVSAAWTTGGVFQPNKLVLSYGNADTPLTRESVGIVQILDDAATPGQTASIKGPDGVGTDKSGGDMTIASGNCTGTGAAGTCSKIILKTTNVGTTGSTQQTSTARLQVPQDGGLQWLTATKPSCDATHRGTAFYVAGATSVNDTYEVCRKNNADVYAWVSTITAGVGGSNTQLQYNNAGVLAGTSGATATATQVTLTNPLMSDVVTTGFLQLQAAGTTAAGWIGLTGGVNAFGLTSTRTMLNAPNGAGGKFDFITGGSTTSPILLSLSKDGILTLDPANAAGLTPQVDFTLADITKVFSQSAGAAPTADNTCAWDSTAHRLKCGENGTSRTLAWTSEINIAPIFSADCTTATIAPGGQCYQNGSPPVLYYCGTASQCDSPGEATPLPTSIAQTFDQIYATSSPNPGMTLGTTGISFKAADDQASALRVCGDDCTSKKAEWYWDATDGFTFQLTPVANSTFNVGDTKSMIWNTDTQEFMRINENTRAIEYGTNNLPYFPIYWSPVSVEKDGTNCVLVTSAAVNGSEPLKTMTCQDGGKFSGQGILPTSYSAGSALNFRLKLVTVGTTNVTLALDIGGQCAGNGDSISSTYSSGTGVNCDVATGTSSNQVKECNVNFTPSGSCVAGDFYSWRAVIDDANNGATAANAKILGGMINYAKGKDRE